MPNRCKTGRISTHPKAHILWAPSNLPTATPVHGQLRSTVPSQPNSVLIVTSCRLCADTNRDFYRICKFSRTPAASHIKSPTTLYLQINRKIGLRHLNLQFATPHKISPHTGNFYLHRCTVYAAYK